jgi:hypothetical protein
MKSSTIGLVILATTVSLAAAAVPKYEWNAMDIIYVVFSWLLNLGIMAVPYQSWGLLFSVRSLDMLFYLIQQIMFLDTV